MAALTFPAQAVAAPQVYATEKRNAKCKPSFIMVDNSLGAADRIITIRDSFLPAVTNGVPIPAAQTIDRLTFTVVITGCVSLQDELKDIEILGELQGYADAADAGCLITIGWDHE